MLSTISVVGEPITTDGWYENANDHRQMLQLSTNQGQQQLGQGTGFSFQGY
jgi:hypothetical protein